jgi:hypothetical protein
MHVYSRPCTVTAFAVCGALLLHAGCVSSSTRAARVQPPSAERVKSMAEALDASAMSVSGRVDLASIALDNAIANQRDAEALVSASMRNRDAAGLAEAAARLQAAQDGVRAAWQAGQEILRQAEAVGRLAAQVRNELVNYELASPGEARNAAALSVARLSADAEARFRLVESLTLELKRRWLLPLPSSGDGRPRDPKVGTP